MIKTLLGFLCSHLLYTMLDIILYKTVRFNEMDYRSWLFTCVSTISRCNFQKISLLPCFVLLAVHLPPASSGQGGTIQTAEI